MARLMEKTMTLCGCTKIDLFHDKRWVRATPRFEACHDCGGGHTFGEHYWENRTGVWRCAPCHKTHEKRAADRASFRPTALFRAGCESDPTPTV